MKLFESILVLVALAASPVIADVLANTNPVAPRTPKIKVDPTRVSNSNMTPFALSFTYAFLSN